jgi:uncharacterized repeat protein (TIGR03847 family)
MERRYEFDELALLSAVAMGVPGKRTFFVAIGRQGEWVRLWQEKHDLQAFALAANQLLLEISHGHARSSSKEENAPAGDVPASGLPSAELEGDEITLGYDSGTAVLDVTAHGMGPRSEDKAQVHCRMSLAKLKQFSEQALAVCAAGRPTCVLCGGPIDPDGHVCPRKN